MKAPVIVDVDGNLLDSFRHLPNCACDHTFCLECDFNNHKTCIECGQLFCLGQGCQDKYKMCTKCKVAYCNGCFSSFGFHGHCPVKKKCSQCNSFYGCSCGDQVVCEYCENGFCDDCESNVIWCEDCAKIICKSCCSKSVECKCREGPNPKKPKMAHVWKED